MPADMAIVELDLLPVCSCDVREPTAMMCRNIILIDPDHTVSSSGTNSDSSSLLLFTLLSADLDPGMYPDVLAGEPKLLDDRTITAGSPRLCTHSS
jgi:hypothetical protein